MKSNDDDCGLSRPRHLAAQTPCDGSIIVAADDNVDDVDLLRLLLRKAGVDRAVEFYHHGEEIVTALSRLLEKPAGKSRPPLRAARARPMLCFLDIKMPGIGGHDVLRWIRGHREFDELAVVMLSSSDHPEDIRQAALAGAQCYLAKYPQPAVLRAVIAAAERFARGEPARECFRLPINLLLAGDTRG